MNSLKNLVILAVLAAAGYGIYVSLTRNNVDPDQPPGVAEGWPAGPKVELPSGKPSPPPGGPLALGGTAVRPAAGPGAGFGETVPPFVPPPAPNPVRNPLAGAPPLTPVTPYPSSAPSTVASAAPTAEPDGDLGRRAPQGHVGHAAEPVPPALSTSIAGRNAYQSGSAAADAAAGRSAASPRRQPPPTVSCRASSPPSWTPCKRVSTNASWPTPISR